MMKPVQFAKGDKVLWQYAETGIPAISRVLRVGYQGIWVRFGNVTCYLNPDMVLAHRPATPKRKRSKSAKVVALQ